MVEVGEQAPNFSLANQDDAERSLTDYKGRWLILYFYPKDDTPGCTKEACGFTESLPQFSDLDATIVGISPDSPEKHRTFIEKYDLAIELLADPAKECLNAYGAWGIKKNYGKEYEGVIRSTYIIDPDGKVAHSWRNVRVNGHVDRVREKLESLKPKYAAS